MALEAFWVPAAIVSAIRGRPERPATLGRGRRLRPRRTGDALEAFTAELRALR
jgi:hypothetical protein